MSLIYEGAISSTAKGGARQHFRGMARAVERSATTRLVVVLPKFADEPAYHPGVGAMVQVRYVRTMRRSLLGHVLYEFRKLGVLLKSRASDVRRRECTVHMVRVSPIGLSPFVMRLCGARVVLEVNGLPDDETQSRGFARPTVWFVRAMTAVQLRAATDVVAVTAGLAAECRRRSAARVLVLENGVDLDDVAPKAAASGRSRTVVYSGAFAPWQELDVVVRAVARLIRADPAAGWRLLLVGDGEQRTSIERAISDTGIRDSVEITGWLPAEQSVDRMNEGQIAVVPLMPKSPNGVCGSPLKLFEYLAAGRTVVGSEVDGISDLDGYPVITYIQGDVTSLVRAIEEAAAKAPPSNEALTVLRDKVSWDDRCRRLLEFLRPTQLASPGLNGMLSGEGVRQDL